MTSSRGGGTVRREEEYTMLGCQLDGDMLWSDTCSSPRKVCYVQIYTKGRCVGWVGCESTDALRSNQAPGRQSVSSVTLTSQPAWTRTVPATSSRCLYALYFFGFNLSNAVLIAAV
jgi:hypothetical protein